MAQVKIKKIKKNDLVKILAGKDKGKTGKVIKVIPKKERVIVEGINLYKKHIRPKREGEKGETILVPRPIHISNVAIYCHSCQRAVRVGFKISDDEKIRICKKCRLKV